jgi:predicted porin
MQKKLIALAVASLVSAPVFAQSNVTVYGIVDMAVGFGDHGDNDFRGIAAGNFSGNRLGFRGTEDLGNGLKAVFTLEYGLTPDVNSGIGNTGGLNSRQTFVGLQGGFGTVSLGRQYSPGYFANYDAILGGIIGPQSELSVKSGMTITPNSPARWDNSIAYTGSFSGLTVRAIYAADAVETANSPANDDKMGLGLDYSNGPLKVGAVYHLLRDASAGDDQKEWLLGAQYDFGVLTLAGSYQRADDINASDDEAKVWQVGVIVPVGMGNVHVAYGKSDRECTARAIDATAGALATAQACSANNTAVQGESDDAGAKMWTLAYTHALSKRTTAYAAYTRTTNDDDVRNFGLVSAPAAATENDEDSNLFVVGMRHAF